MTELAPCPGCRRHVRISESACPFCACALDLSTTPSPVLPPRNLSRAALLAFGATLAAGLVAAGCGSDGDGGGSGGAAGQSSGGSAGSASGGGGSSGSGASGGAVGDGSAGSGGSGGQNTGGAAGNIAPPYGIPPDF